MNIDPLYKDGGMTGIDYTLIKNYPSPPPEPRPAQYRPSSISTEDEFALHWFWRYCFPFVMFGVLCCCLFVQFRG